MQISTLRMCGRSFLSGFVVLTVFSPLATPCLAGDWPGFRGPSAMGVSQEAGAFPDDAFSLKVAWKVAIGSGYSGPAIQGDRVVTCFAADDKNVIAAFDKKSGKELWRTPIGPVYKGHDGSHDGPIATPHIHGGRVFMFNPQGTLAAFALKDGKQQWSRDLVAEHQAKAPFYGFAASPIVADGVLVVQAGAPNAAVMGFEPATGEKLWAVGDDKVDYQSPIVHEKGHVLAGSAKNLIAIKPKNGEVLWTFPHGGNERGAGSMVPVPAGADRVFLAHKEDASMVVGVTPTGATPTFATVWEGGAIRKSFNVPVYLDNHLYAYSARFLTCVDVTSGDRAWRSREPGDGFLTLVGDHLVISTKEGGVHVVSATPTGFRELASVKACDEVIWSHPAFSGGSIYVRSVGELARIDVVPGEGGAVAVVGADGVLPESRFGRFVASLASADDKPGTVASFIKDQTSFPIIEGKDTVHFVFFGEGKDLALAGDMFGARQERPMNRVAGANLFYYSMKVAPDTRLNYVFMRDYETIVDPRNPNKTVTTLVDEEMEMSFTGAELPMSWFAMPEWTMPTYLSGHAETPAGTVETIEMESEAFDKALSFDVYTDPGFALRKARYPVLYVHGGAGAVKYGELPKALDLLIGKTIDPVIVVFIKEGSFRAADKYVKMFGEELIPFIDKKYPTIAKREARACYGAGFSGTDALFMTFSHPELVGKVASQSAFIFDSFTPDVVSVTPKASEHPMTIYMDWGKYDFRNPHEAWDMSADNKSLYQALTKNGYRVRGGEANDGSGWSSWRNRLGVMLESLFPKS